METELHCCGEGENLKMVSFQVFFRAVQTQLHRIIKIGEIWGSLQVLLNKLLLWKTRAACFVSVPDASRQPGSCQGQVQEQLHFLAWVGNTSTSKGHSVSPAEMLCQYHHLESIHLPVFFFTNVLCSKRLTLPVTWQYHGLIDKATKATPFPSVPTDWDCI